MIFAVMEKGEKKMSMRDYEDMKDIVIPKEQEEMMNIICDAWEECRTLKHCRECPDRPKEFMRMMMCTSLKYTRKFIEAGYTKQPTADVQDIRHGRWHTIRETTDSKTTECTACMKSFFFMRKGQLNIDLMPYCPHCGAKMDLED